MNNLEGVQLFNSICVVEYKIMKLINFNWQCCSSQVYIVIFCGGGVDPNAGGKKNPTKDPLFAKMKKLQSKTAQPKSKRKTAAS